MTKGEYPPAEACPVCGSMKRGVLYRGVRDYITDEAFDVMSCRGCGLGITSPMPDDNQIGKYYSASYRGDRHAFTDRARIWLRSRSMAKHFPPGFRGRMLDIGCGAGSFALFQKRLGWNVAVTEIHEPTLEQLKQQGIEAVTPKQAFEGNIKPPFDAITCWHVLEHALHPQELANWARSMLSEKGIFQVSVPNVASWQARMACGRWLHLDVPRHRYHFDPHTLRKLLHDTGFEIVASHTVVLEYDWFGAIQSPLNGICSRHNVLFEKMTSRVPTDGRSMKISDQVISYAMAPAIAAMTLPACLAAELYGAGATLEATCKSTPAT